MADVFSNAFFEEKALMLWEGIAAHLHTRTTYQLNMRVRRHGNFLIGDPRLLLHANRLFTRILF